MCAALPRISARALGAVGILQRDRGWMVGGKLSPPWPGFKLDCSLALLLANPVQVACCKN